MRVDVITLFPELFAPHLQLGVTHRAFGGGSMDVRLWPLRDFAEGNYRRVDDRPYGGGPGMVLTAPPLLRAVDAIWSDRGERATVIQFCPSGVPLTHALVRDLAQGPGAILVCGRYEGIDQRFVDARVNLKISLGDFVLSGGEIPALALLDAMARLQDGVLSAGSAERDSFADGLLEGPCYTRPERLDIDGVQRAVPDWLLSGDHGRVQAAGREAALATTQRQRPDLIEQARRAGQLSIADERFLASLGL